MTNNKNINSVRYIEKSDSVMVKTPTGETCFINVNLIKHELEIPYTKKSGEYVTKEQIIENKIKSQTAYINKIQETKKQKASA